MSGNGIGDSWYIVVQELGGLTRTVHPTCHTWNGDGCLYSSIQAEIPVHVGEVRIKIVDPMWVGFHGLHGSMCPFGSCFHCCFSCTDTGVTFTVDSITPYWTVDVTTNLTCQ